MMKHVLWLCWLTLAVATSLGAQRGLPRQEGIANFGKVNDTLYRGAQPDAAGITNLSRLGIKTIINLRQAKDVWKEEEAIARANGILYTNMPLRGLGRPTNRQIAEILAIIATAPLPVFVHCEFGCDRTGTVIACYRIKHHKWSGDSALQEARKYGMSKWERGMRRFILDFWKSTP
jgi:protein tyrosine/serine phosphatase